MNTQQGILFLYNSNYKKERKKNMKRILAFILSLSVMLTMVGGLSISVFAEGTLQGSGTSDDPYLITSAEDFALIENDLDAYYKQTADFDVTAPVTGTFTGVYDGDGHTISVNISAAPTAGGKPIGLFYQVAGIAPDDEAGTEAVYAEIKNLTVTGSVENSSTELPAKVGAFVGMTAGGYVKFTNLTNHASVYSSCSGDELGGIVGRAYTEGLIFENCKNYGYIKAWSYAGGIIGMGGTAVSAITFTNCANLGYVYASTAGGIVGWAYMVKVSDSYNLGHVKGSTRGAGVTPYMSRSVTVENFFNGGFIDPGTKGSVAAFVIDISAGYNVTISNAYNSYPGLTGVVSDGAVENVITNVYNVNNEDTGCTYKTEQELMALDISEEFTVYENVGANGNKSYRFPQLADNLIPLDVILGTGTSEDPYLISNGQQFNKMFGQEADMDTYRGGKYYHIVSDISLVGLNYLPFNTPQETAAATFSGYLYGVDFDGNPVQRTIDFGTIGSQASPYVGMPNKVGGTTTYTGAIAGICRKSGYKNLTLEGTLYAKNNNVGGMIGYINADSTLDNIINNMTVTSTHSLVGGIAGVNAQNATVITNCVNNGAVTGAQTVGGIVGSSSRPVGTFKNNKNTGYIKSTGNTFVGGLVGTFTGWTNTNFTFTIDSCINEGKVESTKGYVGGIIGCAQQTGADNYSNLIIKNSKNSGEIIGANYVGGILGGSNYDTAKFESEIDIISCVNTGTVNASNQYVAGIAGSAFNSRISYCKNLGKVVSTYADNHSYAGGILGFTKVLKPSGTFGIYNSFNAGEISYLKTRNGGLVGYIWKETASSEGMAAYEIKNSFAIGELTTTTANVANGSFIGSTYRKTDYANDGGVVISGCYSTLPYNASCVNWSGGTSSTPVTISDSYNASELASAESGYTMISEEELIDLTNKEGSVFNDTEVWAASENGYSYPQIVGNVYDVKLTPVPYGLAVERVEGAYTLSWDSKAEPSTGYKVLIDGVQFGDIITSKSLDITSGIIGKAVTIKVVAIDSEEYESEEIEFAAIFAGGGVGSESDPYVVSSAEELSKIKDYPDAHFVQGGNITGVTAQIGFTIDNPFTGSYNGAGYSIDVEIVGEESGLSSDSVGTGLFPYIGGAVVIKDLTVTGSVESHSANTGAIVGVVVSNGFTLTGLTNYASVVSDKREVAGIAGRTYKKGTITECYNYGSIKGATTASGITGVLSGSTTLSKCGNYGTIEGDSFAAGISAWSYNGMTECFNVGKIVSLNCAMGIVGQLQSNFSSTGKPQNMSVIKDCYNSGTLVAPETYGIAARGTGRDGSYTVEGCYNAVDADYPICDLTDEFVTGFNTTYSQNTGVKDCFYLTADTEGESVHAGAVKVTTPDALENIVFANSTAYSVSGDYKYPQLTNNKIEADYDDIAFVVISTDTSALTTTSVAFKYFDKASFVKAGDELSVVVTPDEFYSVEVFKGAGSLGVFEEAAEILVEVNADTVISATEEAIEASEPSEIVTADKVYTTVSGDELTVGDETYQRFAIVAGKVGKAAGLKLKEFGALINRTYAEFTLENTSVKAPADVNKINKNGWYGILIYSKDAEKGLKDGKEYFTRPYAIYVDKDGVEYTVYGEIQSFVLTAAPAVAE